MSKGVVVRMIKVFTGAYLSLDFPLFIELVIGSKTEVNTKLRLIDVGFDSG